MSKLKDHSPDIDREIHQLFRHTFSTNCHLDGASITQQEVATLQTLSTVEVLENFRDLITSLLDFKLANIHSDSAELADRCEKLESMLQRHEAEIREHIKMKQQLLLHGEELQAKLEECEAEVEGLKVSVKEQRIPPERNKVAQQAEEEYGQVLMLKDARISQLEDTVLRLTGELKVLKETMNEYKKKAATQHGSSVEAKRQSDESLQFLKVGSVRRKSPPTANKKKVEEYGNDVRRAVFKKVVALDKRYKWEPK